jgi:phthiocerol/phenolphthiocerol synthesis type-I polyketide synthase D
LSLDWGAWSDVGLAVRTDRVDNVARQGLALISPEDGAELFERALSTPTVRLVPIPVDFRQWRQANPQVAGMPLLREVMTASAQRTAQKNTGLFQRLRAAASEAERIGIIENYVRVTIAGILRSSPEAVTQSASLKQLGFDSLMMVSLKNTLERDLGIPVSTATLFTHRSLEKLATYLAGKLVDGALPASPRHEPTARERLPIQEAELPEDIETLSDDEASAQLAATLRRLQADDDV